MPVCQICYQDTLVKILDGNVLAATEHRLKVLRQTNSAPMPGKSLVVLDPALMLAIDVFPCEDGHAQERSLLTDVLPSVEAEDVWIADRNFCTNKFLFGIAAREGYERDSAAPMLILAFSNSIAAMWFSRGSASF